MVGGEVQLHGALQSCSSQFAHASKYASLCRRGPAAAKRRDQAQQKAATPSVTVSDTMTVHQLAQALDLKAVDVEESLNSLGESVASHEDMCAPCLTVQYLPEQS